MVRAPLITVLVFGAVIRRLLGIPLGLVRTVFAAALAYVIAGPLLAAFVPDGSVPGPIEL